MSKILFVIFFIFSIPSIGIALPKCEGTFNNCIGSFTFDNGDTFDGEFVNNKLIGPWGTYIGNNGGKYVGYWINNRKHGWGEVTYNNGHKYEGEFVDGKRNGWGVFTYGDGTTQEGVWKNNKFLYAKKIEKINIKKRLKFKGRKLVESTDKTNITNLKEYNYRPSIGFSNLHPAIEFVIKNQSGALRSFLAVEEATKCSFKARYKNFNSIIKVKTDFNKINWKTWSTNYIGNEPQIQFKCKENCFSVLHQYDNYKASPRKDIFFKFKHGDNISNRAIDALTDISKICNRATSQY